MGRAIDRAKQLTDRVAVEQEKGPGQGKTWKHVPRYTLRELLWETPDTDEPDDDDLPEDLRNLPAALL